MAVSDDEERAAGDVSEAEAEAGAVKGEAGDEAAAAEPPRKVKKKKKKKKVEDAASAAKARLEEKEGEDAPPAEGVTAPPAVTIAQQQSARRALGAGATLGVLGLVLVGIGPSDAGMALVLGGLLVLIYGIHTYGRLGPEPAR